MYSKLFFFFFTAKRHIFTMSAAIFAVVKKYTQLACIFTSKMSRLKNLHASFFVWKYTILNAIYALVSAAMPVACTV